MNLSRFSKEVGPVLIQLGYNPIGLSGRRWSTTRHGPIVEISFKSSRVGINVIGSTVDSEAYVLVHKMEQVFTSMFIFPENTVCKLYDDSTFIQRFIEALGLSYWLKLDFGSIPEHF
jgi:hypothetical protein